MKKSSSPVSPVSSVSCPHCEGKGYISIRDCSGEIQREETCVFCGGRGTTRGEDDGD